MPSSFSPSSEAKIDIIEEHLHNRERWFGKTASQTATDWGTESSLTPYRAISGNGDFGSDTDDEAQVIGTDDTPSRSGMLTFDFHRILITAQDDTTAYYIRIIWGTGTMAAAETAGQYTDVPIITDTTKHQAAGGQPIDIITPRLDVDTKVWARAKNSTDNSYIDFLVGLHEYD